MRFLNILVCPVCKNELNLRKGERLYRCSNGHSFDLAKEGYVNLLVGSRSGEGRGDSKASARARKEFLDTGTFSSLKTAVGERMKGTVLDICCGEGYYDTYSGELYGFDLSKEMVRLAAKRNRGDNYRYFVGNLSSIPVASSSVDTCIHLFAPFHEKEFSRVMKDDGRLYSVIPGKDHLIEIKERVYEKPYRNDEKTPETEKLILLSKDRVKEKRILSGENVRTLFSMTPYYYRTSEKDRNRLLSVSEMEVTLDFLILEYGKNS